MSPSICTPLRQKRTSCSDYNVTPYGLFCNAVQMECSAGCIFPVSKRRTEKARFSVRWLAQARAQIAKPSRGSELEFLMVDHDFTSRGIKKRARKCAVCFCLQNALDRPFNELESLEHLLKCYCLILSHSAMLVQGNLHYKLFMDI